MPKITKIQKYSIHDGDGIRTTIFFKGCPLKCGWCHNPETISYEKQLMFRTEDCVGCGSCETGCKEKAISLRDNKAQTNATDCVLCGECLDYCIKNLREISGEEYDIQTLVDEVKKDQMFYEDSGGGVTLSGGEVMTMDMDYIERLVKSLNRVGIKVNIDTCGQAPYRNFQRILPYVDTFLYDLKIMNNDLHKKYVGVDNSVILDNLISLSMEKAKIYLRMPIIEGVNATEEEMQAKIEFLKENRINFEQINLLPYHNIGKGKYEQLGMVYNGEELAEPTVEKLEFFKQKLENYGYHNVKIGG